MENTINKNTEDFKYSVHNGEVTIDKYIGNDTAVIIPSEIDGKAVKAIGNRVFEYCANLESVTFDKNSQLTNIGQSAFYGCFSLKSIKIPDDVESIGADAFYYCNSLKSIDIPDSVTNIGDRAFQFCLNLESIVIGDSVESIGDRAFYCANLKNVTFGKNSQLASIGERAFCLCSSLESVEIPSSVKSIEEDAFDKTTKVIRARDLSSILKKTGLSSEQIATIDKSAIPHKSIKDGNGNYTVVFRKADLEKINQTLSNKPLNRGSKPKR